MKKYKSVTGILEVLILFLLIVIVNLWSQAKDPSFDVYIGTPIDENTVEFGEVIEDKELVNNMLLAMINSESIEKPKIADELPYANIRVDDVNGGICYLWAEMWMDGADVIYSLDTKGETANPRYKKINGGFGEVFEEVVEKDRDTLNQNIVKDKAVESIEVKLEGSSDVIQPNYYLEGFDFNYDELPIIDTLNIDNVLKFKLSNNDIKKITVAWDYYNVLEDKGVIEKERKTLDRNDNNEFELPVNRKGNVDDEKAIYYIYLSDSRKEDVYVFQVDFIIEDNILEEAKNICKENGYSLKGETPIESEILIGDADVFEFIKEASIRSGYDEAYLDSMTEDRKVVGYELNEKSEEDGSIMLCLVVDRYKVIGAYLDYDGYIPGIAPVDFKDYLKEQ